MANITKTQKKVIDAGFSTMTHILQQFYSWGGAQEIESLTRKDAKRRDGLAVSRGMVLQSFFAGMNNPEMPISKICNNQIVFILATLRGSEMARFKYRASADQINKIAEAVSVFESCMMR